MGVVVENLLKIYALVLRSWLLDRVLSLPTSGIRDAHAKSKPLGRVSYLHAMHPSACMSLTMLLSTIFQIPNCPFVVLSQREPLELVIEALLEDLQIWCSARPTFPLVAGPFFCKLAHEDEAVTVASWTLCSNPDVSTKAKAKSLKCSRARLKLCTVPCVQASISMDILTGARLRESILRAGMRVPFT
jgi:hypothetical protein